MKTLHPVLLTLLVVISAIVGIGVAPFSSLLGAQFGGLEPGGWNWQFFSPLLGGGIIGIIITVVGLLLLLRRSWPIEARLGVIAFGAPVFCFIASWMLYGLAALPAEIDSARYEVLLQRAKTDPAVLEHLLAQAKKRSATEVERMALRGVALEKSDLTAEQLYVLLDHFQFDDSMLASLLNAQPNLSDAHFSYLYERYKRRHDGEGRLIMDLSNHDKTPPAVLRDIIKVHQPRAQESGLSESHVEEATENLTRRGLPVDG